MDLCTRSDDELCTSTGGTWEVLSCGHYTCGQPPVCAAIIPGCDCGVNNNFLPGEGCVEDRACLAKVGELCGGFALDPRRCEPGLQCYNDPDGGVVDGPGTCVLDSSYICSNDDSCPTGASCCYPCGIPGCNNACQFVDGGCPQLP